MSIMDQMYYNELEKREKASQKIDEKGYASDVIIVVKGKDNSGENVFYLVTGSRKNDPGKGKSAWIGGLVDPGETYLETAIREAGEEIATFSIAIENQEDINKIYALDIEAMGKNHYIQITTRLGKKDSPDSIETKAKMCYLDTIQTSDLPIAEGGEKLPDGTKRVYETSGYLVFIDLEDRTVNEEELSKRLVAGDDMEKLQLHEITDFIKNNNQTGLKDHLQFGIKHHNDFIPKVVKAVKEI